MQAVPLSITVQINPATAGIMGVAMTYRLVLPDGTDVLRQQDMGGWSLDSTASVESQVVSACEYLIGSLRAAGFDV